MRPVRAFRCFKLCKGEGILAHEVRHDWRQAPCPAQDVLLTSHWTQAAATAMLSLIWQYLGPYLQNKWRYNDKKDTQHVNHFNFYVFSILLTCHFLSITQDFGNTTKNDNHKLQTKV